MTDISTNIDTHIRKLGHNVLRIISARLKEINSADSNDIESLMKLQSLHGDFQEIDKLIVETIDKTQAEIYNVVKKTAEEYYQEAFKKHNNRFMPFEKNLDVLRITEQTKHTAFEKIANSLNADNVGFINRNGTFRPLAKAYREIINAAVTKKTRGEDIGDYVEDVINPLAEKGLVKK